MVTKYTLVIIIRKKKKKKKKLENHPKPEIFLGYASNSTSFKILDIFTNYIISILILLYLQETCTLWKFFLIRLKLLSY